MRERVLLFRPLSGMVLHSEVPWKTGSDSRTLNAPGDISFSVPALWAHELAEDGLPYFADRGTLVVVERPNRSIRNVGLVDSLSLSHEALTVSCGGLSMLAGQSGPWEGEQGWYTVKDALELFHELWNQFQSYDNSDLGIRVVGDTSSGSPVGYAGSRTWRHANDRYKELKTEVDRIQASVLTHERVLSQRKERLFKKMQLRRVGDVHIQDSAPDDPGYKADSTVWIRYPNIRPFKWYNGAWYQRPEADQEAVEYRTSERNLAAVKERLNEPQYRLEPWEERLDELESQGREDFSLYFWQNHDMDSVIEDLRELGRFEYREEAAWTEDEQLDLMIRAGTPQVGVRREELPLELGVNVVEQPEITAPGDTYTGVALFGSGEGSEVLSEQRDFGDDHVVRRILTETDKNAHTKQLTRAAADRMVKQVRADMRFGFTDLVIQHDDERCSEGSFNVGDEIPITGVIPGDSETTMWVRVLDASNEWGSQQTSIEVERI